MEARKGLGVLLDAMTRLPGVTLTAVGGSPAELAALDPAVARAEAAGARIDRVGRVEPAAVRGWYRRARVGVCPLPRGEGDVSERFTSPMKVADTVACGTAVVASDLPSVRELLTDGVNARPGAAERPGGPGGGNPRPARPPGAGAGDAGAARCRRADPGAPGGAAARVLPRPAGGWERVREMIGPSTGGATGFSLCVLPACW